MSAEHDGPLARPDWDEPIDLMDIVGGGRLGTGVKKSYVFGGKDPVRNEMKVFSVEWAAM